MKEIIIDGNVWGRGHSTSPLSSNASLVSKDGTRLCCIAILGESLGVERGELDNNECNLYPTIAELAGQAENFDWREFYCVNDDRRLSDAERAERLRPLFAEIGYTLKFVNVPGVDEIPASPMPADG